MERIINTDVPKTLNGMPPRFDYNRLAPENILHIKRKANEIRTLFQNRGSKVYGSDVFPIGAILLDVRLKMSQQLFDVWLEVEAQIPKGLAGTYTIITRKLGHKSSKLQNLTVTALYELTLPSYPQSFLERVFSGEYVPDAKEIRQMRILPNKTASANQPIAIPETENKITDLHARLSSIAEDTLVEGDKEIKILEEKVHSLLEENEKLLEEKNYLKSQIDRIYLICKE